MSPVQIDQRQRATVTSVTTAIISDDFTRMPSKNWKKKSKSDLKKNETE